MTGHDRIGRRHRVMWIALFLLIPAIVCQAEMLKTMSGYVQTVDVQNKSLAVYFKNPATGADEILAFVINQDTGFGKRIKGLGDFKAGDPVSVDYAEGEGGRMCARHITRVLMEGPPEGFKKFKGFR